jgi:DNA-binding winged helix-turn-helix (wHTH) protein/tetratricopeptide (TPR) repeat protein
MDQLQASTLRIGDCILDRVRGTLVRGAEIIAVRAKTFALLTHLADNRGRVISKDELLAAIWPDVTVSEDSLTQCVRDLRKALGDEEQNWVRTVSRRGYLLAEETAAALPDGLPVPVPDTGRVVAVLPFDSVGDADPVLIDGIIEEITNGLARFRTVTVIARASAFSFPVAGRPMPQIVGEKLGADHLVEGTFRKTPTGYRISVALTHAPTAHRIWSEQFDCAEADVVDIDAVIARRVIGRLVVNIEESVLRLGAKTPTNSLKAFEYLMRGRMHLRGYGKQANADAVSYLSRAVETDPDFGLAQAYLALAEIIVADYGAAPRHVLEQARDRLTRALTLAPEDSRCHRIMGLAQLYLREHAAAEYYLNRALYLNPYDADTLAQLGFVLTMRGRAAAGLVLVERSIALNPFRPPWYDSDIAFAFYALGRYEEAIDRLIAVPDTGDFHEARLAGAYAMAGNTTKAVFHISRALEETGEPDLLDYLRKAIEFEHEQDMQHFLNGVRLALAALQSPS